jgi:hypothetical protein
MGEDEKDALAMFMDIYLNGKTKAEQVDALEDLSAELLVRADDLRAEMAAAADAPAGEES